MENFEYLIRVVLGTWLRVTHARNRADRCEHTEIILILVI